MGPETRLQSWLILAVMAAAVIAGGWKLFGDPATVWQWIGRGGSEVNPGMRHGACN